MSDLPIACRFLACKNPCLRGLAGTPFKDCVDLFEKGIHRFYSTDNLRMRALRALENPPKCAFCGETDIDVLCIDHIYNDGGKERKSKSSSKFYGELLKMSFKERIEKYQVLCRNCNWKKHLKDRS